MASYTPTGANPQTSAFTCNTCGIKFPTAELQRQHMKTDWHRYNLKRRVAELPTISSSTFAELLLARQNAVEYEKEHGGSYEDEYGFVVHRRHGDSSRRQLTKKDIRRLIKERQGRTSTIVNSSEQPRSPSLASVASDFSEFSLGSNGNEHEHLHEVSTIGSNLESSSEYNYSDHLVTDSDFTEVSDLEISHNDHELDDSEGESFEYLQDYMPITTCFYCGHKHNEREENIRHMFLKHGLYIPERSYLVNPDGLLTFLGEVVVEDNECLVCGFLGKNLESVRQHMTSKGHCRIPYETREEKDVISEFYDFTIPEVTDKKIGKKVQFQEGNDINEDDVNDDDDDKDEEIEDEDEDEEIDGSNYTTVQIDSSGVELTLPTGSRIGHRSMTRYYRQNLPLPRDFTESQRAVAVADRRFAPGLTGAIVTKQEKLERRIENRYRSERVRRDRGSKINYQPHFRDEMLQ